MKRTKLYLVLFAVLMMFGFVTPTMAAPGDLLWSANYNPSTGYDVAYDVARDSSGIYLVGTDRVPGAYNGQWIIQKRNRTTGALIWSKASNPTPNNDEARGVAVDSTGIYVVGWDLYNNDSRWRIEKRSLGNGNLIWSKTSNPSTT